MRGWKIKLLGRWNRGFSVGCARVVVCDVARRIMFE